MHGIRVTAVGLSLVLHASLLMLVLRLPSQNQGAAPDLTMSISLIDLPASQVTPLTPLPEAASGAPVVPETTPDIAQSSSPPVIVAGASVTANRPSEVAAAAPASLSEIAAVQDRPIEASPVVAAEVDAHPVPNATSSVAPEIGAGPAPALLAARQDVAPLKASSPSDLPNIDPPVETAGSADPVLTMAPSAPMPLIAAQAPVVAASSVQAANAIAAPDAPTATAQPASVPNPAAAFAASAEAAPDAAIAAQALAVEASPGQEPAIAVASTQVTEPVAALDAPKAPAVSAPISNATAAPAAVVEAVLDIRVAAPVSSVEAGTSHSPVLTPSVAASSVQAAEAVAALDAPKAPAVSAPISNATAAPAAVVETVLDARVTAPVSAVEASTSHSLASTPSVAAVVAAPDAPISVAGQPVAAAGPAPSLPNLAREAATPGQTASDIPVAAAEAPAATAPSITPLAEAKGASVQTAMLTEPPKTFAATEEQLPASEGDPAAKAGAEAQIRRYIEGYEGGPCFFVSAVRVADAAADIDGFSASNASFQAFNQGFVASLGFEPLVTGQKIWSTQCPAVDFLRHLRPAGALSLTLDKISLRTGEPVRGILRGSDRFVSLFQVSHDGWVRNLSAQLRQAGEAKSFTIPVPIEAGGGPYPEILLAIASAEAPIDMATDHPVAASDFFSAILAEASARKLRIEASAKLFLLQK